MNLPTPTRVPFRGTHFVEAAAFDSVVNQLHSLQTKADTMAAASAIPADGPIEAEALAELSARAGGSQPSHALAFIAEQDKRIDDLLESSTAAAAVKEPTPEEVEQEKSLEVLCHMCGGELLGVGPTQILAFVNGLESELNSEKGLHSTTKSMLASSQSELAQLTAWLRGESPTPYTLHIKELADSLRQKVLTDAASVAEGDTDHTAKGGLPDSTGGNLQATSGSEAGTLS